MDKCNKNTYEFLSQFLTEPSHSFGFKPLDDLEEKVLDKLKIIYDSSEEFEYLKYEQFMSFKEISKNVNKLDIFNKDRTFEIFNLIIELFEDLDEISRKNGKLFSTLIEDDDISPNILFDFQPIYKVRDKLIIRFDRKMIPDINGVNEEYYEDDYGIMYNFLIRNFFDSKCITLDNKNIFNTKELFEFFNNKK